ncbi:hypothetical protein AB0B66_24335 [Catellatospora sp. NPDC049111]|uniref:hypothetical protein n=1 Tax=Catellatospora sp. NPDC049111 TaxID=3155271 RepID=UPI0033C4FF0B
MPIETSHSGASSSANTAADVTALVELLGRAATDDRLREGLGEEFAYVAGVCPELFRPHQEEVVTRLFDGFEIGFDDMCILLDGAPDACVEHLVGRLRERGSYREAWALAAIGTEAAHAAIAELVRGGADRQEFEDCGVWTPPTGPAQRRFSAHRRAVHLRPASDPAELLTADHPVGLPLARVVRDPDATPVAWHYLSLRIAEIPGMPRWPAEQVHLASPRGSLGWTLSAAVGDDGRWHDEVLTSDEPGGEDDVVDNDGGRGLGTVLLRPYDADLVYANWHILSTPGVFGTAGGPAIGLYPNPHCRSCDRLMFHVVTVQNYLREYGHGWRTLYLCEDCEITTCTATNWN